MLSTTKRILISIPAYNEESTISEVVQKVRRSMAEFDLLVVNDGSQDRTGQILDELGVVSAVHLCNLGYGRAIQTAIKYALKNDYEALITLDADGQHNPEHIQGMMEEFVHQNWDYLIGSRYIEAKSYKGTPLGRRAGMQIFSWLTKLVTGKRIYDTTSGLKIIHQRVFEPLTQWHFVDFHAEAIVYLARLGFRIGEHPVRVSERKYGSSMYSLISSLVYPLKTFLMVFLSAIQASLTKLRKKP